MKDLPRNTIIVGDVRDELAKLPPGSIDCVVTSPPYYQLRNYGVDRQIGMEPHVDQWVDELMVVMRGLARVLKPTGSLWLNVGDSYSRHSRYGAPAKSLLLAPERLVSRLVQEGWILRNKIVWAKPNPMPHSVTDRLTTAHEFIYLLTRSPRYFFDLDAIRVPHTSTPPKPAKRPVAINNTRPAWAGPLAGSNDGLVRARLQGRVGHVVGKNPTDVWNIAARGFRGAHFATYPEDLVVRPILAGCPEAICTACGTPWKRQVHIRRQSVGRPPGKQAIRPDDANVWRFKGFWHTTREIGPLIPCGCGAPTRPGIVLDPFIGSGTTAVVVERLGRNWVGIEINEKFAALARQRIEGERAKRNQEERRAA